MSDLYFTCPAQPQHVFDGEMFHSILRSLRRDKAAAPKGPHSGPLEGPKLSSVDITDSRLRSPLEGGREKSRALDVTRETKSEIPQQLNV